MKEKHQTNSIDYVECSTSPSTINSSPRSYQIDEGTEFFAEHEKQFPQQTTVLWKVVHASLYSFGAILFTIGSFMFFPGIDHQTMGAVLFIIGSTGFIYGDAMEWWVNNRVGCVCYKEYEMSYESQLGENLEPVDTFIGKYQRAANGVNYFISVFGSLLYFIGSVYFVPAMHTLRLASALFIGGSFFVFLSQLWKLWRLGSRMNSAQPSINNFSEPTRCDFKLSAFRGNWLNFWVKFSSGLGGAAYLIGSVYFLPQVDTTDAITDIAAFWFVLGSAFYACAAVCLTAEYYSATQQDRCRDRGNTSASAVDSNIKKSDSDIIVGTGSAGGKQKYTVVLDAANVLQSEYVL